MSQMSIAPQQQQHLCAIQEVSPERIPSAAMSMAKGYSSVVASPLPTMSKFDSSSSHHSSSASRTMFSPCSTQLQCGIPPFASPPVDDEKINSARKENPLVKQFSGTHSQSFTPKVQAFEPTYGCPPASAPKHSLYERVILNTDLDRDFFAESSSDEEEIDCPSDDSAGEDLTTFRFNEDHCLHVFNTLKNGGASSLAHFDRLPPQNGQYVSLNG